MNQSIRWCIGIEWGLWFVIYNLWYKYILSYTCKVSFNMYLLYANLIENKYKTSARSLNYNINFGTCLLSRSYNICHKTSYCSTIVEFSLYFRLCFPRLFIKSWWLFNFLYFPFFVMTYDISEDVRGNNS